MTRSKRIYDAFLAEHFSHNRQLAFVSGPRQVGKTTTCREHADFYVNWDSEDDRERLLAGSAALVETLGLNRLSAGIPGVLFDELHKYPRWKQFLKGFFDVYGDRVRVIVTGSSRGIGAAIAEDLARKGHRLVLVARDADRLDEVAARVRGLGAEALAVPADLRDAHASRDIESAPRPGSRTGRGSRRRTIPVG